MKKIACTALSAALIFGCIGVAGCSESGNSDAQTGNITRTKSDANGADADNTSTLIADIANMDREYTQRDKDASYDKATSTNISLEKEDIIIDAEGTYILSGTLNDGQVIVDAANTDKIQIVLDGVNIHNEDGPAIYIKQADKCFITLAEGSTNTLTDGAAYTLEDDSDEPYATLFSKDDLTINGSGTLNVNGTYKHGICSKDDLVITGGVINVKATEDALRGRDCVKIADGIFTLESGEDAIKSNNDEDPTRGFVSIDGGTFTIDAGDDAVHGEFAVFVEDGNINISTCVEGLEAQQVYVNGGNIDITSSDDSINASSPGESTNNNFGKNLSGNIEKNANNNAEKDLDGKFNNEGSQNASDSAAPFDGNNGSNSKFGGKQSKTPSGISEVNTGSQQTVKGMRGDTSQNGTTPPDANGSNPPDFDGNTPPDFDGSTPPEMDGSTPPDMNNNGRTNRDFSGDKTMPNDPNSNNDTTDSLRQNMGSRMAGGMPGEYEEGCLIEINGGGINLTTEGDGIDSNGDFTMNGGTLFISGPTNSGNGSLDIAGSAIINDGTVFMAGSAGMAQSFSDGDQAFLSADISGKSGEAIKVTGPSGEKILSYTPDTPYSLVIVSSPLMKAGTTYTITAGQTSVEAKAIS